MHIFDLEGTLSNSKHREHLVPDWDKFHELFPKDDPIVETCNLFRLLCKSSKVIIVTGMMEKHRGMAEHWLNSNRLFPSAMLMRGDQDLSPSPEYKLNIISAMQSSLDIEMVYDDREDIISTLLINNIPAIRVNNGQ